MIERVLVVRVAATKPGIAVIAVLVSVWVFLGVSLDGVRSTTYAGYLASLPLSIVTTAVLCLCATTRIDALGSELRIVNILVTWRIPRESIEALDMSNGVRILAGGRVIDSIAWGPSVLQILFTSRRLRRVQRALRDWFDATDASGVPTGPALAAPRRLVRPAVLVAPVAAGLASVGASALLWAARAALLPIING